MVSGFCFSAVALAVRFGALAAVAAARARPCTQAAFVVLPCMLAVAVVFPWTPAVFAAHHPDTPAALAGFHLAVDFGAVVAAAGFAASSYCVCLVCVFSFRTPCAFSYFLFRGKMLQGRHILASQLIFKIVLFVEPDGEAGILPCIRRFQEC